MTESDDNQQPRPDPATPDPEPAEPAPPDTDPAAHDDPDLGQDTDAPAETETEEGGDPYGGHAPEDVKHILEAGLFAAGTALSVAQLGALFADHQRPHRSVIRTLVAELMAHYRGGGVELVEVASGWRFQTRADLGPWISRLWEEKPQRYSRALLETLALIAYRQPITRSEIEDVRGVSVSSSIIRTLAEREWVRVVGHRDVPGRPAMYATTRQFLDHFGLSSLDQLPSLGEIRDLDDLNPELELGGNESDSAGAVDQQAEISFSSMVDRLREDERSGKTGNDFIDETLDDELSQMDAVNASIEQSFESQRAGHNQPALDLSDDAEDEARQGTDDERGDTESASDDPAAAESHETGADDDPGEAERLRIIQEKLAQQQALLDARESDPSGGADDNEQ